jgi:hypothetical protein
MKRFLFVILILTISLAVVGCNISTATPTPAATGTALPEPTATVSLDLTLEQVKNAEYTFDIGQSMASFRLKDGAYQNGSDPSKPDYLQANIADKVTFGDLNGDGIKDAAVVIGVNTGGTGVFEYVVSLLSKDGQPVQGGYSFIDDRARIDDLKIEDGEIVLDATVHGPADAMCCPNKPVQQILMLPKDGGDILWLAHQLEKISSDSVRNITITSPEPGTGVNNPFSITGKVTIAPFENNLVYHVYDMNLKELQVGPLMVDAPDMGAPGTFTLTLDLSATGYTGPIFVTISDLSAADGSILAMDSIILVLK